MALKLHTPLTLELLSSTRYFRNCRMLVSKTHDISREVQGYRKTSWAIWFHQTVYNVLQ